MASFILSSDEYEYDDEEEEETEKEKDQEANTQEDVDPLDPTAEYLKHQAPDNDEGADDDDDQCEEWERLALLVLFLT